MLICLDEDIPDGRAVFEPLGEVRTFAGRTVSPADVAEADALIVRSVTPVNAALLAGSRVRFAGTVTTGSDHVDTAWLADRGIAFAAAEGCNAETVSQYVLAAILLLCERRGTDPTGHTLGVIGVGRIGSRVARWAEALGFRLLLCDPPRRRSGESGFLDAAEVLPRADFVTLHVPLTDTEPDATRNLMNAAWLARMRPSAVLINTSRGGVVREEALAVALAERRIGGAVLDVWRDEPNINPALLRLATLVTPHIAGYSHESRRRAVWMIRQRLESSLVRESRKQPARQSLARECLLAPHPPLSLARECLLAPVPPWRQVAAVVRAARPLEPLDTALRAAADHGDIAAKFDDLRIHCSALHEFDGYRLDPAALSPAAAELLTSFGFAR